MYKAWVQAVFLALRHPELAKDLVQKSVWITHEILRKLRMTTLRLSTFEALDW
jgi:hypothetical protein